MEQRQASRQLSLTVPAPTPPRASVAVRPTKGAPAPALHECHAAHHDGGDGAHAGSAPPPHLLHIDAASMPADGRGWFRFQRAYDSARHLVRSEAAWPTRRASSPT